MFSLSLVIQWRITLTLRLSCLRCRSLTPARSTSRLALENKFNAEFASKLMVISSLINYLENFHFFGFSNCKCTFLPRNLKIPCPIEILQPLSSKNQSRLFSVNLNFSVELVLFKKFRSRNSMLLLLLPSENIISS